LGVQGRHRGGEGEGKVKKGLMPKPRRYDPTPEKIREGKIYLK